MSYVSVWRATARALAELGAPAFFIAGVAWTPLGSAMPWLVLAAVVLGMMLRAADVEARALFVPGGLYGSVRETLGPLAARASAAGLLVDRFILGALAAVVAGHYLATLGRNKVGFTVIDHKPDGQPVYIGNVRGLVERNCMRYWKRSVGPISSCG